MARQVYIAGRDKLPEYFALEAGDTLDLTLVILPGYSCNVPLRVEINGEGASAVIRGLYLCPGDEDVRISVDMVHNCGGSTSQQMFKGIVGGHARSDFFGKITVAPDAQKTQAYQSNHNLLLSEAAKVYTKPQLEIYADDVKCSHGATVGRLDEEEQFYMRSRGISEKEARALQMISFISPVISEIQEEKIVYEILNSIRSL